MGRAGWGTLAALVWCLMGLAVAFHIPGGGFKSVTNVSPLSCTAGVQAVLKCLPGGSAHQLRVCGMSRSSDLQTAGYMWVQATS